MAKRRTLQETRGVLLEAGRELVHEFEIDRGESTAGAMAHIRASDVAARADLSKGMVYHLWDDQDDYRRDLLIYLSADIAGSTLFDPESLQGDPTSDAAGFVRDNANAAFETMLGDPTWRLFIELCSYVNDPEVREPLQEAWTSGSAPAAKALEEALRGIGRTVAAPLTIDQVVHSVRAIGAGFRLLVGVDPDVPGTATFDWEASPGWTLYAIAVHSTVMAMTQPA